MPFYQNFISTRNNEPDMGSLINQLRSVDASAGIIHNFGQEYTVKKNTAWTAPQTTAVQNAIDNAPAQSAQLTAQTLIDQISIADKAIVLALLDEINILRANAGLAVRTPAQAISAIRAKAGTL